MTLRSGTLFVVATPIGNLEDITARALRVLREVAIIAAEDTRRTAQLLARHQIPTPTTSLHDHNEREKTPALIARLERGESVAVVSDAGTPVLSDPGAGLIRAAIDAGVRVEPIPGPSAILAALAVSGFPTEMFSFLGFPPTRLNDRNRWFERLKGCAGPAVFFESPHRLASTLERLQAEVGDCEVLLARELTKIHEELVRGPISAVLMKLNALGEYTVVANIGHMTEQSPTVDASDEAILTAFTELTTEKGVRRREALSRLGRKFGKQPNEIYRSIERLKKSVK